MSAWGGAGTGVAALKVDAPEVKEEEAAQVGGATVTKAVIDTNAIVKGFRLERFAEAGLVAHLSPRHFCGRQNRAQLMTASMVHHVTNLTPPGSGSDNPKSPCNQTDTPRECVQPYCEEAVTISEVLAEVKDKQARHTLQTLPFELKVKDPDEASIKAVRRFAKLTGDIGALSEPDIRVIALAYMLERDAHGVVGLSPLDHIL
jgi:hypothetical protein